MAQVRCERCDSRNILGDLDCYSCGCCGLKKNVSSYDFSLLKDVVLPRDRLEQARRFDAQYQPIQKQTRSIVFRGQEYVLPAALYGRLANFCERKRFHVDTVLAGACEHGPLSIEALESHLKVLS